MLLIHFIEKCGSQAKAARKIGVGIKTVNRWLKGHTRPRSILEKLRLQKMRIEIGKRDWDIFPI